MNNTPITRLQALYAMSAFLQKYYMLTGCDYLFDLTCNLRVEKDGTTGDPIMWYQWQECIESVLSEKYVNSENGKSIEIDEEYYEWFDKHWQEKLKEEEAPEKP